METIEKIKEVIDYLRPFIMNEGGNIEFDKYGILRYVTDVNGFKTVLDYDDDYNLSKITTPSGKTFGVKQDKFGHIKELSLPDGGKVSYKYDEQGNLVSVTDPNGTTKEYHHDIAY